MAQATIEQLLTQRRLINEAEKLGRSLLAVSRSNDRALQIYRNSLDRVSRRRFNNDRMLAGLPVVTTAGIAQWIREHMADYIPALISGGWPPLYEMASDVCEALDVYDEDSTTPGWVIAIVERQIYSEVSRREHLMQFFAPKVINYESDGDVLFM